MNYLGENISGGLWEDLCYPLSDRMHYPLWDPLKGHINQPLNNELSTLMCYQLREQLEDQVVSNMSEAVPDILWWVK
tara:strand:- start:2139 stop:2369 length:231 start_codon:yes stop_codon:yes gene_type:complete